MDNYRNTTSKCYPMAISDFINIGNPRKIKGILTGVIDQNALDAIETEIKRNTQQLFDLALYHYRFAAPLNSHQWRQKISRLYYSGYCCTKATRYFYSGVHSTDSSDHKKVGELPSDFPNAATFKNKLTVLRDDRNTCDYDHASKAKNLIISTPEATSLIRDLLNETKVYFVEKGFSLRGKV